MSEFTLYSYQCSPIRLKEESFDDGSYQVGMDGVFSYGIPSEYPVRFPFNRRGGNQDRKRPSTSKDAEALFNMANHQTLLDAILTSDLDRHFGCNQVWENLSGGSDKCQVFYYKQKPYYFKVLIPCKPESNNSCYLIRIANLKQFARKKEVLAIPPDAPSSLVIIDNRTDQQRILIERTPAWPDTDSVRTILQEGLGEVLRECYQLDIRIESVWQKNSFENVVRRFVDQIQAVDFHVPYPNMGRTGDKFLLPLKEALKEMYAYCVIHFAVAGVDPSANKRSKSKRGNGMTTAENQRTSLILDPNDLNPICQELAELCRTTGSPIQVWLEGGNSLTLQRVPEAQLKRMSRERRKQCEQVNELYCIYTVRLDKQVSSFDGQVDQIQTVLQNIMQNLEVLRVENA
ncbi:MAG: hypothetical protein SOY43_06905 [Parabacteroides sp.]|nr:hypothetical protein [bacterium]MDY4102599.1 hypothetical protein [Parabacteroides sp.]